MKQSEAKRLLIQSWDEWISKQPQIKRGKASGRESLRFFYELQNAESPLLKFNSRGRDKWPILHNWLLGEGRISD